MVKFNKIEEPEIKILVSLEEYKELLVTKGKYESLSSNIDLINHKVNKDYIQKFRIINYLNRQIIETQKTLDENKENRKSELYISSNICQLTYQHIKRHIERGEFDAD